MTHVISTHYAVQQRNVDDHNGWATFRESEHLDIMRGVFKHWQTVNHTHNMQYRLVKLQIAEITEVIE